MADSGKSRRVLMLVYGAVRDDARVLNEARSLRDAGYTVQIIGAPRDSQYAMPSRESIDGINVWLTPLVTGLGLADLGRAFIALLRGRISGQTAPMPPGRNSIRTLINLLLFNLWVLRVAPQVHVIHCHDTWPLPAAWFIARRQHARFVYDDHEATQHAAGIGGRVGAWLERVFAPRADAVITIGELLKQDLVALGAGPVTVIGNWKRKEAYAVDERTIACLSEELGTDAYTLVVSYVGLLFEHRELKPLIEAAKAMPDVLVLIAGRGDLQPQVEDAARQYANIRYVGWLAQTDVPAYTRISDVIYCCLSKTAPTMRYASPNKLFEAIITATPIIATRGVGEIGQMIERDGIGYLVDDNTSQALMQAFDDLQDADLRNEIAQQLTIASEEYNWEMAEARLTKLYASLL